MTEIQGGGSTPISLKDKKMYMQEYRKAAELFENALVQYEKSDNPYQQEAFKKVMSNAMQILNEAASGLKRQGLLRQNAMIQKDFDTFENHDSKTAQTKLKADLEQVKKTI